MDGTVFTRVSWQAETGTMDRRSVMYFPMQVDGGTSVSYTHLMHGMAVFSEDIQKENEGYFRKSEERLAREQRKLSHCVKGSNNYYRQKKRVALCHEKIRNQRKDFLHKLSHEMVEAYDVVAVEDIDMKAMSQCMHFGKSVMDNSYGKFRERCV